MNQKLQSWIEEVVNLVKPEGVVWIDGSKEQLDKLTKECLESGELHELNQSKLPNCYLHRTAQNDVARVEDRTFICSQNKEDAGPTNNWCAPSEMKSKLSALYDGVMRGRTMYVIPYIMGPSGSPFAKVGIEVTDSRYVVLNMNIMARIGEIALNQLGENGDFVKCLHSVGDVNPEERYITHFPETSEIWSINSAYGGNVLLGKKCFALRIASVLGRNEGWLAEHMLILGLENPQGETNYVAAAFPSACGKTNLAMLIPPETFKGYKVTTVGDDIAWIRVGDDGRLWAVNPEAGFFGVAPMTSTKTNKNALLTTREGTIFTNVALNLDDNTVWWEGADEARPQNVIDWKGNEWHGNATDDNLAHANSRFTAPARNCPSIDAAWESPEGVPLSAIIFGGRRAKTAPLVYQARDWEHGVFIGATMASETTAAAAGAVGIVRRDPFAMLPFCGYNMGDYFAHWLEIGKKATNPPQIFHVNWFKKSDEGKFLWPGFGENVRVLKWILDRANGNVEAQETQIGYIPFAKDIDINGIENETNLEELLAIDAEAWLADIANQREFFAKFDRLPKEIANQIDKLEASFKS